MSQAVKIQKSVGYSKKSILQHVFNKIVQVIVQLRISLPSNALDNFRSTVWFQLRMPDLEEVLVDIEPWTNEQTDIYRPLYLVIGLDGTQVASNQVLLLNGRPCSRETGAQDRGHVALEHWYLVVDRLTTGSQREDTTQLYKRLMVLVRSIYSYCLLMPAYKVFRQSASHKLDNVKLVYNITDKQPNPMALGLVIQILIHRLAGKTTNSFSFGDISTSEGTLSLHTTYRSSVNVEIREHEQLLSSRFIEDYFNLSQSSLTLPLIAPTGPTVSVLSTQTTLPQALLQSSRGSTQSHVRPSVLNQSIQNVPPWPQHVKEVSFHDNVLGNSPYAVPNPKHGSEPKQMASGPIDIIHSPRNTSKSVPSIGVDCSLFQRASAPAQMNLRLKSQPVVASPVSFRRDGTPTSEGLVTPSVIHPFKNPRMSIHRARSMLANQTSDTKLPFASPGSSRGGGTDIELPTPGTASNELTDFIQHCMGVPSLQMFDDRATNMTILADELDELKGSFMSYSVDFLNPSFNDNEGVSCIPPDLRRGSVTYGQTIDYPSRLTPSSRGNPNQPSSLPITSTLDNSVSNAPSPVRYLGCSPEACP